MALARLEKVDWSMTKGVLIITVTSVRLEHPMNAPFPILFTLLGITILVKPIQPWNAPFPIISNFLGILIDTKLVHPLNALSPIIFTLLGISIDAKLVHPLNASFPILVTLWGITILLRLEHPSKSPLVSCTAKPRLSVFLIDAIPMKYKNSSNEVISVLLNTPFKSVTAIASRVDSSPSPLVSQFSTHMAFTFVSAKLMDSVSSKICPNSFQYSASLYNGEQPAGT